MSEEEQPTKPTRILVPTRYLPGDSKRFYDDFFEMGFSQMPPPPPPQDGSLLELTKHYLLACCPRAGAYTLPDGLINIISDCADSITSTPDKDIFHVRQKEPVALAMKEAATPGFDQPRKAIASLYLATQFEFYFRILSELLNSDGSWKSVADQEKAKSLLPEEGRIPAQFLTLNWRTNSWSSITPTRVPLYWTSWTRQCVQGFNRSSTAI